MTRQPWLAIVFAAGLVMGACTGDDGAQDTESGSETGGDGSTAAPPQCVADTDCGECQVCDAGVCVEGDGCADTAAECTQDTQCGECEACDAGVCQPVGCDTSSGGEMCQDGQWCDEGISWCEEGQCVDVPAPAPVPVCDDPPEFKLVEIDPQIQNLAVGWVDIDASTSLDIVTSSVASINTWLAPDWSSSKTALAHIGGPMDILRGHADARVVEVAARMPLAAVHTLAAGGGSTELTTLDISAQGIDVVAFDSDGDGVDEAAVRTADGIVQLLVDGANLTEGAALYDGSTHDVAVVRGPAQNQIVAGVDDGRAVVIALADDGSFVAEGAGLVNPWGADLVFAVGGKVGLVGNATPEGSALTLGSDVPFATSVGPEAAASAASLDANVSVVALGGDSELVVYRIGDAGPECALSLAGGPFEALALADLDGGTLGVAVVVAGQLQQYTVDILDVPR